MQAIWLNLCRFWELRVTYREWAHLHDRNAENYSEHALACDRLADDSDHQGLAFQAAVNREVAKHSRRVADYYRRMGAKYRRASRCPWSVVPDDPEPPTLPDPVTLDP
jgi:hypothetical protein